VRRRRRGDIVSRKRGDIDAGGRERGETSTSSDIDAGADVYTRIDIDIVNRKQEDAGAGNRATALESLGPVRRC
jgi:hypothetical protein